MMKKALIATVAVMVGLVSIMSLTARAGDDKSEFALKIGDTQAANLTALKQYAWQRKTTLESKGEVKGSSTVLERFGDDGKLTSTPVDVEGGMEKKRGLRGHVQEKKLDEFADYLEQVATVYLSYAFMTKGELVDMLGAATFSDGDNNTLKIDAKDIYMKGDALTMIVDKATSEIQNVSFNTKVGDDPMTGTIGYKREGDTPNHPSQYTIEIPSKAMKITADTSNYVKQA